MATDMFRPWLVLVILAAAMPAAAQQLWERPTRSVQLHLSHVGLYAGTVDGRMGPETQQALKLWQEHVGLEPTGKTDELTLYSLFNPGEVAVCRDLRGLTMTDCLTRRMAAGAAPRPAMSPCGTARAACEQDCGKAYGAGTEASLLCAAGCEAGEGSCERDVPEGIDRYSCDAFAIACEPKCRAADRAHAAARKLEREAQAALRDALMTEREQLARAEDGRDIDDDDFEGEGASLFARQPDCLDACDTGGQACARRFR